MSVITDEAGRPILDEQGRAVTDGKSDFVLAPFSARDATFFLLEVAAFLPVDGGGAETLLRVSDQGYRTRASDVGGVVAYPALLDTAFEIDRRLSLDPAQPTSRSDGAVRVSNLGNVLDAFVGTRNVDARRLRILIGQKKYDSDRGIYTDPAYSTLAPFFGGLCSSWLLSEDALEVPIKDTSYWTSRPIQSELYGKGTNTDGGPSLLGKAVPLARGGNDANPIKNVPLLQIDQVANLWQWTGGAGTIVHLYEGGKAVFAYAGDVDDLSVGETPPGNYRTTNAKGILQLGSPTVNTITADVTGNFDGAGYITTPIAIAYGVLTELLGFPAEYCDQGAFADVDAAVPYIAGFWDDGTSTGLQIVQDLLTSAGARLGTTRSGLLRPYLLQQTAPGQQAAVALTVDNTISVTPAALPSTLDPPPYRWRVGFNRNWTVQTSGLNASVDDARKVALSVSYETATWTDQEVQSTWLRPGDPAPLVTYLLDADQAQAVAEGHGTFWRSNPGYYTVVVPMEVAAGIDFGDFLSLTWPLGRLAAGATVVVVGEQTRSYDATVSLEVLTVLDQAGFSDDFSSDFLGGSA
jgi:hypothetical protein